MNALDLIYQTVNNIQHSVNKDRTAMDLKGEQLISASRQQVWDAINEPAVLLRCIPGCEEVTKVSEAELHTRVLLKIGPVRARFSGKIFLLDIEEPSKCTLSFEGAGGAAGFARGKSDITLTEHDGQTLLSYSSQASVGGKLGQVGGRLIESSAKKMADEFFAAFQVALSGHDGNTKLAESTPASVPIVPHAAAAAQAPSPVPPSKHTPISSSDSKPAQFQGFQYELYRAFWFALGVGSTLLISWLLP
ncbi:SRPBCC family protein [Bordetella tumulicola]|uniref:SRPBCC family protein n=1 Tax=Bordetella tumulicola TaxID=1649133 RepID=UPI0039F0B0B2